MTKLFLPPARPHRIRRARILEYLNDGLRYPLILVSSQAGSGKTTALAEWIGQLSIPAGWISLDEGDNDFARFLAYLVAALRPIVPQVERTAAQAPYAFEPASVEYLMASLINDLSEAAGEFVLALDDYHLIQSDTVQRALVFLLEHQPLQLHLAIATRVDPRFPLARMRSRGVVLELRMDQFRFTEAETATYLNGVMQLGLPAEDLAALQARTEGWIASLQMAALSLRSSADARGFIQAFSGSNRFVMDYLVEEALEAQPPDVQAFLLQTSLLERLSGPLCDAVCDRAAGRSGQEMLEYLERSNLFISPLDDERRWFRYHHLFASLLRARLAYSGADARASLHLRASAWYEANGYRDEAIHHALAARDFARAARLVEGAAESAWLQGEYFRLMAWIKALPDEVVRAHPWLCVWNAWSLTQTGLLADARAWITAAEQAAISSAGDSGAGAAPLRFEITTLQALTASLAQDYERASALAAWVLENPSPHDKKSSLMARCHIYHGLSSMYFAAGELDKAESACLETIRLAQEIGFTLRYLHAVNKLGYIYETTGQLHRAYLLLQEALVPLDQQGAAWGGVATILRCRLHDLLYEWNRTAAIPPVAREAVSSGDSSRPAYLSVDLYNLAARDCLAQGDLAGAQSALGRATGLAQKAYIWPGLTWRTEALQVRLWLLQGETALAAAWADRCNAADANVLPFSGEHSELARARIFLAQGEYDQAFARIERLAASAAASGRKGSLVEIGALEAVVLHAAGRVLEAVAALERTLALAEGEGYVRTFLDAGEALGDLLARVAQKRGAPQRAYAGRLLDALRRQAGAEIAPPQAGQAGRGSVSGLVEPLSRRESEVLRCMAEGLSNREAARRLVIETSTVKRHINNIFSKLGVNNRVQALNKAKEYGLL